MAAGGCMRVITESVISYVCDICKSIYDHPIDGLVCDSTKRETEIFYYKQLVRAKMKNVDDFGRHYVFIGYVVNIYPIPPEKGNIESWHKGSNSCEGIHRLVYEVNFDRTEVIGQPFFASELRETELKPGKYYGPEYNIKMRS